MAYSNNPMKLDLPAGGEDDDALGEPQASPGAERPADATGPPEAAPADAAPDLEERIVRALKTVYDPEIPVDIYELGLVYDLAIDEATRTVHVKMTLTSPACPVAGSLPGEVQQRVESVAGVERAEVEIVWDPAWNPSMMSEVAKLELGFF